MPETDAPSTVTASRAPTAIWLVLLAAAGTFALTMGTRQTMGLFLSPINTATGLGVGQISLAFAFGQLWWGLTQPFAGMLADKVGTGRAVLCGLMLMAAGSWLTPHVHSTAGLILAIGVLAAGGAGMAGPSVLMAATTRLVPPARRGLATGIVNAGGSLGQFIMAPLAGWMMGSLGWVSALQIMGLLVLMALPAAWVLRGHAGQAALPGAQSRSTGQAVRTAVADRSYQLLCLGFFVCGFHIAFLATHLPGVIASCGLGAQWGAWALATIGLFNMVGSIAMGWAVGRWRMKSLLSLVYLTRGVAVLAFVLAPKTPAVVLAFAALMGVSFLSTVPPTAGLVARFFGTSHMATLFGLVMVAHQMGGFLGAWLGGRVLELTGSYNLVWYADIVLALGAALVHLPIKEAAVVPAVARS
jgi:predicted MFS family arabinose efflux permease